MTIEELEENAEKGISAFQIELALCLLRGTSPEGEKLEVDYPRARSLLEQAHANGVRTATEMLAEIYENGRGIKQDVQYAVSLYADASSRGSYLACIALGRIYAHGKGELGSSVDEAIKWYSMAIEWDGKVDDFDGLKEANLFLENNL